MTIDYNAIALKIVPPGQHPTVSRLRALIAATLEKEINAALNLQRDMEFPDLMATRKELAAQREQLDGEDAAMKRKHRDKQAELEEREQEVAGREAAAQQVAQRLQKLLAAIDSYAAWMNGDGEIDENGRRFAALWEAYLAYSGRKESRQ